jgi:hypothetical protein
MSRRLGYCMLRLEAATVERDLARAIKLVLEALRCLAR